MGGKDDRVLAFDEGAAADADAIQRRKGHRERPAVLEADDLAAHAAPAARLDQHPRADRQRILRARDLVEKPLDRHHPAVTPAGLDAAGLRQQAAQPHRGKLAAHLAGLHPCAVSPRLPSHGLLRGIRAGRAVNLLSACPERLNSG